MQEARHRILWLQAITLLWMSLEMGVALFAAARSHSAALLAFGADSLIELLSALVVLLPFVAKSTGADRVAARLAGILLFALALVVTVTALLSLALRVHPEASCSGLAITAAALVVMPLLAALKRRLAAQTGNVALAADAVQSATCAWIALFTLLGVGLNALFHIPWLDSIAALAIVPLLVREGRSAIKGQSCGCTLTHTA